MKKKSSKYLLIAVLALIGFAVIGKVAGWFGQPKLKKVATELPKHRDIVETITANGKVQPQTEVQLSPDVSGEIVDLYVVEGQEVQEGDLLLKIRPDIYLSNLDRVRAALNSSKSNMANSKARQAQIEAQYQQTKQSFERSKKLWEQNAISQAEYENAVAAYDVAKAEVDAAKQTVNSAAFSVKSAEASLKEANENLTKTSIYAPMNGTVSMLNVEKGERVVGTIQMAGTEMLRVADLHKMEVEVDVNENDIVKVSMKDTAIIEIDAYLGTKFKGIVTEIANSATSAGLNTDQVTNFKVKVLILRSSYKHLLPDNNPNYYPFRPGMSATVDIQTNTRYNVLCVPIQAVTIRIDTTKSKELLVLKGDKSEDAAQILKEKETEMMKEAVFTYNAKSKKVSIQYVKTGIQDDMYIEITKGISDSLEVVVAPYRAVSKWLKDGARAEKTDIDKLFDDEK